MGRKGIAVGDKYGMLSVVEDMGTRASGNGRKRRFVLAKCACGTTKEFDASNVLSGTSTNCGCVRKLKMATHMQCGHPLYARWLDIKRRTSDPKHKAYKNYGGRGVGMYAGWVDNPMAFFDYVEANLGPPPSTEHSIDRVDNGTSDSGGPGYVPGNITWASKLQQTLNRRTTRFYTHEGQTLCLAHWARYIGISPQCLRHRLAIGTPFEQAINTPGGAL